MCTSRLNSDCVAKPLEDLVLRAVMWSRKSHEDTPNTVTASLHACDKSMYLTIHTVLEILLSLCVSTAGVEKTFSALRRVTTWLQTRIGEERLIGLALLNIHRDIHVSAENITERFVKTKKFPRFLNLKTKFYTNNRANLVTSSNLYRRHTYTAYVRRLVTN